MRVRNDPVAQVARAAERIIGWRIAQRRRQLGLKRTALAEALGVSVAQVGKIEIGVSALSAGRMQLVAAVLNTTITDLYDDENFVQRGPRRPARELQLMAMFSAMTEDAQTVLLATARMFATRETR